MNTPFHSNVSNITVRKRFSHNWWHFFLVITIARYIFVLIMYLKYKKYCHLCTFIPNFQRYIFSLSSYKDMLLPGGQSAFCGRDICSEMCSQCTRTHGEILQLQYLGHECYQLVLPYHYHISQGFCRVVLCYWLMGEYFSLTGGQALNFSRPTAIQLSSSIMKVLGFRETRVCFWPEIIF